MRWALLAAMVLPGCTCSSRPHLVRSRDGGPAVIVVKRDAPDAAGVRRPGAAPAGPPAEYLEEREPDDDLAHAQPLEPPRGIHGTLVRRAGSGQGGDVDLFQWQVAVEVRSVARIELDAPPEASLEVLDGSGAPLPFGGGGEHVFPNLAASPGERWFLRVRGPTPGETPLDYRLLITTRPLQPGDEEEPNDGSMRATALPSGAGGEQTGFHGWSHDEDWLKLPEAVAPGSTLRAELSPVEGVAVLVRLRDGEGLVLAESRGGRGNELRLRNLPAAPGDLLVLRSEGGHNADTPWRLRWALEPPLTGVEREPNGTSAIATSVEVNAAEGRQTTVVGFLWPGDIDLFRVHAVPPGPLDVEVRPPEGVDVRLERLLPSGKVAEKEDRGGAGKTERLAGLDGSGDILLRVSARPRDTAFDAPYRLVVTLAP